MGYNGTANISYPWNGDVGFKVRLSHFPAVQIQTAPRVIILLHVTKQKQILKLKTFRTQVLVKVLHPGTAVFILRTIFPWSPKALLLILSTILPRARNFRFQLKAWQSHLLPACVHADSFLCWRLTSTRGLAMALSLDMSVTAEPLTWKIVCLLLCKWSVLWKLPGIGLFCFQH